MNDAEVDALKKAAQLSGVLWSTYARRVAVGHARRVLKEHRPLRGEVPQDEPLDDEPKLWGEGKGAV